MSAARTVRLGIVGAGGSAGFLAESTATLPSVTLTAVADARLDAADEDLDPEHWFWDESRLDCGPAAVRMSATPDAAAARARGRGIAVAVATAASRSAQQGRAVEVARLPHPAVPVR